MNPHFQPHNNPPYPLPNPGYPQPNPYDPQQAQPGPNRYPDLPPIQNPQQNQPYPQPQPYKGGVPCYIPPSQYGNIQGAPIEGENSEKAKLEAQMEELEYKFKTGYFNCYICWSYFILIVSMVTVLYCFPAFFFYIYASYGTGWIGVYALWLLVQSYFVISADRNKSLMKANVACWMMGFYLAFSVVIAGGGVVALIDYMIHPNGFLAGLNVYFFLFATVHLLIHIFVNVINAFEVKKILAERAEVELKLVEKFFNNNA